MATCFKQTNSLLLSETLPIGNYLMNINTHSCGRSKYPEDGLTPKTFGSLLFKFFSLVNTGHSLLSEYYLLKYDLHFCNQSKRGSKSSIVFPQIRVKSRFWTTGRRLVKKLYQAYLFAPSLKKSTPDRRLEKPQTIVLRLTHFPFSQCIAFSLDIR